ncbi:hypothetical protein LINGRAHAP2_LOCUS3501 [Linum grandiflorum]
MLVRGDFDLNAVQTDPVEVLVRQALLKQEVVFGQQVHELHRLSSTRRSLAMVGGNEFDSYNSRNVRARSSCLPPRYEVLAKDARFPAGAEVRSGHPLKQRCAVNLQLSADDFIHRSGEDLRARGSDSFMTREEVKLSLGTGHRSRILGSSTRFDNKNAVVIDLEGDSVKFGRMPGVHHGMQMQSTWLDRNRNLKSAVVIDLEDSVDKVQYGYEKCITRIPDVSAWSGKTKVVIDLEDSPEINNDDVSGKDQASGGQWLAASERGDLDLNEVYQEGNVANCALFDLNVECEYDARIEIDTQIDLNHMPTRDGETETSCGTSGVENQDLDDSSQNNASLQDQNGNKSPASCKSCISDNDSTAIIKRTQSQSNMNCPATRLFSIKQEEDREEKPVKVIDTVIKRAAVSLLFMALDNSLHKPKPKPNPKPEQSLDSYELIVMNLEHNIDVDDSASSGAFDVEFEEKDQGSKWKRGRRLKDFQREILPCLASLSRHEIREDINILEGVLRSREYRRMQAMAGGGSQLNEGKRKRTRRNGNKAT